MKMEQLKLPALITILMLCAVPVLMQQCRDFGLRPLSSNKLTWEFYNFTDFGVGGECYLCVQIPANSGIRDGRLIVPCLSSNVIELRISWFSYGTGQTMEDEFFLSTVPGCDVRYNSSPIESFSVTNRSNNSFSELSHDLLEVTVADKDVDRVYRVFTSPRLDVQRTACIRDITTYTYTPTTTSTEPYAPTTTSTEPYAPTTTSTEPNAPTNTSTEPYAPTTPSTEQTIKSTEAGATAAVSKTPSTAETAKPDRPILLIAVLAGLGLLFCILVVFGFICLRRREKSKPSNGDILGKKDDDEMVYNPVYDSKESVEESKTQMRTSVTYEGIDEASKDHDNDVGAIYNDCYEGFKPEKDDDGTVCNHDYHSKESNYEDTANVTYKGIRGASEDSENEGGMIYNDCYEGFKPNPKNDVDKQERAKGDDATSHVDNGGSESEHEVNSVRWSIQKVLNAVLPVYGTVDKSKKKGRNPRDFEEANTTTGEGEYAGFGGGVTVSVAETSKNEGEHDYTDPADTLKHTTPVYGEIDDNDTVPGKRNVRWSLKNALTAIPLYGKVETKKKRKHGRDTDPSRGAPENSVNSAKPDNRNIYAEVEQ